MHHDRGGIFPIMTIVAGIDIGGTKCAVSLGQATGDGIEVLGKRKFPTPNSPHKTIENFLNQLDSLLTEHKLEKPDAIGISCGGPLNSRTGMILSPPNLPGWDRIDVVSPFRDKYHVPTALQNDANACGLAEWKWGAGKGFNNVIFLTFGTGMGSGLILDGKLYAGTNDMAGEVGHIRLEADGPAGYGKAGSFEGFCSGGGIARLAQTFALKNIQEGQPPSYCPSIDQLAGITAQSVGEAAQRGDQQALEVFRIVGERLGRGLAVLVDTLNPECIVIGSIYGRQQELLEPLVKAELEKEALPLSLSVCRVVSAGLGEQVGDFAALSVGMYALESHA
jgi:glucokinase